MTMIQTRPIKNQKPHSIEANLKYLCPNPECGLDHWLSLREVQTPKYRVVCECGQVFRPKLISELKIVYSQIKKKPEIKQEICENILNKVVVALEPYGFSQHESSELVKKAYAKNPTNNIGLLIKNSLLEINHG